MSTVSTHILDTAAGAPATGVVVRLQARTGDGWTDLGSGTTNADGRVGDLLELDQQLGPGTYRMVFATGDYFAANETATFYPSVEVIFEIAATDEHYHVPLLLSPFGYSTYRGS